MVDYFVFDVRLFSESKVIFNIHKTQICSKINGAQRVSTWIAKLCVAVASMNIWIDPEGSILRMEGLEEAIHVNLD